MLFVAEEMQSLMTDVCQIPICEKSTFFMHTCHTYDSDQTHFDISQR